MPANSRWDLIRGLKGLMGPNCNEGPRLQDGFLYGEIDGVDIKCGHLVRGGKIGVGGITETVTPPLHFNS